MEEAEVTKRGVLNAKAAAEKFQLIRYTPSSDLEPYIQRYWMVKWDLRGQAPFAQELLTHPNVNLVFEQGKTRIYGIEKTRSFHHLEGEGVVFGVKFKPGGFYPFYERPVSSMTDSSISFGDVFGGDGTELEQHILSQHEGEEMVKIAERFLRDRLPEKNDHAVLISQIVERIMNDRKLTKVDDVVDLFGLNIRTIQRLFNIYVGVSPKWVIMRYRLHEAAEQMENGSALDWPELALSLGYYDQAHFIKDFKAVVGRSPEIYTMNLDSKH